MKTTSDGEIVFPEFCQHIILDGKIVYFDFGHDRVEAVWVGTPGLFRARYGEPKGNFTTVREFEDGTVKIELIETTHE